MDTAPTGFFSISPARISALIAVLALFSVVGWNIHARPEISVSGSELSSSTSALGTSDALASFPVASPTPMTPLGASIISQAVLAYDNATKSGAASEKGIDAVQAFAESFDPGVQYKKYSASDIQTDTDTSKDRVLNYRADLRTSLAPLLENKESELDLFASYVDTKDSKYLNALRAAAENYRLAIAYTEKVKAPSDAAAYHAAILTAMSQFATMLEALVENADDPLASATLLKTYLVAQDNMVSSFNAIGKYASLKLL